MSANNNEGVQNSSLNDELQEGLIFHNKCNFEQAKFIYERILKKNPRHFQSLTLLGTLYLQIGEFQNAIDYLSQAIRVNPNHPGSINNIGVAHYSLGHFHEALETYNQAISLESNNADYFNNRGNALKALMQLDSAINDYSLAINHNAKFYEAFHNRGLAWIDLGERQKAALDFEQSIQINPNYVDGFFSLGNLQIEQNNFQKAIYSFTRVIELNNKFAQAYNNRAVALEKINRLQEALIDIEFAINLAPNYAQAYENKGNILQKLSLFKEAIDQFQKAILLNPNNYETHLNMGNALLAIEELEQSIASYDRAIEINPNLFEALNNKANALQKLYKFDKALAYYNSALDIKNNSAELYYNRGKVLEHLNRFEEALQDFNQSINLTSDAKVYVSRGHLFHLQKSYLNALKDYLKAIQINPMFDYLHGTIQHLKMQICDWSNFENEITLLNQKINSNEKVSDPFSLLGLIDSPNLQKACAEIFAKDQYPNQELPRNIENINRDKKIRIGYFSADFHNHATAYLMAELFESHNKLKFEIIAFSYGPNTSSKMRERLINAFHQFIDVQNFSDVEVALLSRELKIDIAIDLKGFTSNSRPKIFSYRAAPIQVNYLGYPGTMGSNYIDYIIADKVLIPQIFQGDYSEKIIYLPGSYQVNDRKRIISEKSYSNIELGLPESGFVFCCFNNNYKITPKVFDIWAKILNAVDGSVLWLLEDNEWAKINLKKELRRREIDENRLIFAKRMQLPEHLARHQNAGLFLDAFPLNGHTTTSDSLWAGLPVITLIGKSFASRVSASLLNAVDLPELITYSIEEYQALAIKLAKDSEKLNQIRRNLLINRSQAPLFDTPKFTDNLETAFENIFTNYLAGLPFDHIYTE